MRRTILASIILLILASLTTTASAQVTFEWVAVGNPGNAPDIPYNPIFNGLGSVAYEYRIAKYEVTNDQYAQFLNTMAATDTNALYSVFMGSDARGGITRSGVSGSFSYSAKTNMGNKPVNYVSFFDAMRFVNWLHNGQPTGAQGASTTEDGVYAISDGLSETRAPNAKFVIPSEGEWYKAAYHQPSAVGGDTDDYWLYATASNSVPTSASASATGDISNPGLNVANYRDANWNGLFGNVTTVGSAGPLSESYYGTSDQGGNVWEWTELLWGDKRYTRGGSWHSGPFGLKSSGSGSALMNPEFENDAFGFRVASPTPVVFEWVTVGNPGNAEDPLNAGIFPGIGSVSYVYRMAKHEVTNFQYIQFLSAVAVRDPNGLFTARMATDPRGGIIAQSDATFDFIYLVKPNMGNKPVNFVSFFNAMRFVNWLHNGQPTGVQDASTTEDGVYAISDGLSETRAVDAKFFIPTENEWYKAAYYDPTPGAGGGDNYWLYPTASDNVPTKATAGATGDISNPGTNVANYDFGVSWNGQNGNVTTIGSAGPLSESFYGTSDQGGNVWEWTEAIKAVLYRGVHGGSFFSVHTALQSTDLSRIGLPTIENMSSGLRVASPPIFIPIPPVLASAPHDLPKQKYISIDATTNGPRLLAIMITETTTGNVKWAGAPFNGPDINNISALSPTPVVMDWSSFSVLHLTGCIIQPFGVYEITFVDDPLGAAVSSAILPASAACAWGDIQVLAGPCDAGIGDIIEAININTFSSTAAFPPPHGDVQGNVMDGALGIGDIIAAINSVTVAAGTPLGYTPLIDCP